MSRARRNAGAVLAGLFATSTAVAAPREAAIATLREAGPALSACWRPPSGIDGYEVTVRLSFRRDGTVLGQPRVVFARFAGDVEQRRVVLRAVVGALSACTPLRLTDGLGGAIAGRPFVIRFVPPGRVA